MTENHRRQITLLVPEPHRRQIDSVRKQYNLKQYKQIAAHVTLCRDDEVVDWNAIQERVFKLESVEVALEFGNPRRNGNFVYLPVVGQTDSFDTLRQTVLDDRHCRIQDPHITVVHPRNGTCSDVEYDSICKAIGHLDISFTVVSMIEKIGNLPWSLV